MMQLFAHSLLREASDWFYNGLSDRSITSITNFFKIFLRQWHYDERYSGLSNIELFIKNTLAYFFSLREFHIWKILIHLVSTWYTTLNV